MPVYRQERVNLHRNHNYDSSEKDAEEKIMKKKSYKYAHIINVSANRKSAKTESLSINFIKSTKKDLPNDNETACSQKAKSQPTDIKNRQPDKSQLWSKPKKKRWTWLKDRSDQQKKRLHVDSATNTGINPHSSKYSSSSDESLADQTSEIYSNRSDSSYAVTSSDVLSARSDYSRFSRTSSERQMAGEDKKKSSNNLSNRLKIYKKEKPPTSVNMIYLKLSETNLKPHNYINCYVPSPPKLPAFRTRGTQTEYRESSTQTMPYLPEVSNDPNELVDMELFKLKDILPGSGPPGVYEVKILERERKRWAFINMLKKQVQESRKKIRLHMELVENRHVFELFEWQRWLHREEYIQECQMMRLEIVIGLFNKREKSMHDLSKKRIEASFLEIDKRRKEALHKNATEYARVIRVVDIQRRKQPRVWRKESIIESLSNPTSEFYAPMIRYGVNPNRRHFKSDYSEFNERIQSLNKSLKNIDPQNLICPFAKLKAWSKPKEQKFEIEQKFCSESNLQALYENLRSLRLGLQRVKITPKCLKERRDSMIDNNITDGIVEFAMQGISDTDYNEISEEKEEASSFSDEVYMTNVSFGGQRRSSIHFSEVDLVNKEVTNRRNTIIKLQEELRCEEIEALIDCFEGTSIGWLMSFLADEMIRLKEQRRLHLFTMLSKQERWHREAREAGLRQKENYLRSKYEEIYAEAQNANLEAAQKYVDEILNVDIKNYATVEAEEFVEDLAKLVDREIEGWLQSFNEVQTPLNYMNLRRHLHDIVIPNTDKVIADLQRDADIKYIINEVIFPKVFENLESFDIGSITASHLVDRLIDNDLYIISTEESSDEETLMFPELHESTKEAHAILRKMIRQSVPGRRWRTPSEREEEENLKDIVNDILDRVQDNPKPRKKKVFTIKPEIFDFMTGLVDKISDENITSSVDSNLEIKQDSAAINPPITRSQSIMKLLESNEILLLLDPDNISLDKEILKLIQYAPPDTQPHASFDVEEIPNTHSIHLSTRFSLLQPYVSTDKNNAVPSESVDSEADSSTNIVEKFINDLLAEVVGDIYEPIGFDEDSYLYEHGYLMDEENEADILCEEYEDYGFGSQRSENEEFTYEEEIEEKQLDENNVQQQDNYIEKKPSLGLRLLDVGSDDDIPIDIVNQSQINSNEDIIDHEQSYNNVVDDNVDDTANN